MVPGWTGRDIEWLAREDPFVLVAVRELEASRWWAHYSTLCHAIGEYRRLCMAAVASGRGLWAFATSVDRAARTGNAWVQVHDNLHPTSGAACATS